MQDADSGAPVTRRGLLRASGVTTGGLLLGGLATGSVAGGRGRRGRGGGPKQGGTGFMGPGAYRDANYGDGEPFTITGEREGIVFEASPSCDGRAPRKRYQGYAVEDPNGNKRLRTIFLEPDRNVEFGDGVYTVHSSRSGCSAVLYRDGERVDDEPRRAWKVRFGPRNR